MLAQAANHGDGYGEMLWLRYAAMGCGWELITGPIRRGC